jgi:hypothetical protein
MVSSNSLNYFVNLQVACVAQWLGRQGKDHQDLVRIPQWDVGVAPLHKSG